MTIQTALDLAAFIHDNADRLDRCARNVPYDEIDTSHHQEFMGTVERMLHMAQDAVVNDDAAQADALADFIEERRPFIEQVDAWSWVVRRIVAASRSLSLAKVSEELAREPAPETPHVVMPLVLPPRPTPRARYKAKKTEPTHPVTTTRQYRPRQDHPWRSRWKLP